VVPELKLDGEVIATGAPRKLGDELDLTFTLSHPTYGSRTYRSPVIVGSYQALTAIGGSVAATRLSALQARIPDTKTKLESSDPAQIATVDREALLGDMFHAGALGYFAQYTALTYVAGLKSKARQGLMPSIGSYGYVPKVNYFFGFPRAIVTTDGKCPQNTDLRCPVSNGFLIG